MRWWPKGKTPSEKVEKCRHDLEASGLNEQQNDVDFLLLAELRSLNGRLVYALGVLSILATLLLAHVLVGIG
jgi:hypothetical protein